MSLSYRRAYFTQAGLYDVPVFLANSVSGDMRLLESTNAPEDMASLMKGRMNYLIMVP